ncbi:MAG: diguanylate cyclase [Chloroflexota bacterium]|nr:diguanylate cyclase [Chloroflexota bacterium]MBI5705248.1 diguanylate cyclase [Chloroflexota bacterium]
MDLNNLPPSLEPAQNKPPTPPVKPRLRFFSTIAGKMAAIFIVMYLVLLTLLVISTWLEIQAVEETAVTEAENLADVIALAIGREEEQAKTPPLLTDPIALQDFVADFAQIETHKGEKGHDIVVVNKRKQVLADTIATNVGEIFDHDPGNEVGKTIADGNPRIFVETSIDYPGGISQLVVPLKLENGEIVGAVILEYTPLYQERLAERMREQARDIGMVSVAILLIGAAMSFFGMRFISRPLRELEHVAERLGQGQLDTPVPIRGADEIGALATAFEEMRVNLLTALNAQKDEMQRRAHAEESLFESNRTLRALINTAPLPILHFNTEGIVQMWNPAAERLFGWSEKEVINRPHPLIPPDKREEFNALRERLVRGETITNFETTRLKKDGERVEVALSLSPLRDAQGNTTGIISIMVDTTERKRAEESVRQANAELAASMRVLEERSAELHLLHEMIALMQSCVSADEAYDVAQRYLARLFPQETGALYLFVPSRDKLEMVAAWGEHSTRLTSIFTPDECWAVRLGRSHHARASRGAPLCRHTLPVEGVEWLCVPMIAQGDTLGILHFCGPENDAAKSVEPSFLSLAETVANSIGLSVGSLRLRETLRQQSIRDPLTGLYNRRYLEETLRREILRAQRANSTLGMIMLDIDHFKRFNDTHGHEAGDAVLSALGRFMQSQVRGEDIACRYGGEEFILVLPGASLEVTRERAEQLRVGAQTLGVRSGDMELEAITLSLGVSVWPQHGKTAEAVIKAADAALYRAKREGRNRVEVAA